MEQVNITPEIVRTTTTITHKKRDKYQRLEKLKEGFFNLVIVIFFANYVAMLCFPSRLFAIIFLVTSLASIAILVHRGFPSRSNEPINYTTVSFPTNYFQLKKVEGIHCSYSELQLSELGEKKVPPHIKNKIPLTTWCDECREYIRQGEGTLTFGVDLNHLVLDLYDSLSDFPARKYILTVDGEELPKDKNGEYQLPQNCLSTHTLLYNRRHQNP